jgi:2-amino-4-hydroxy-6-hydroxymethyldihydropteridine diphosphokinase
MSGLQIPTYIGLGSNLDDPIAQIRGAFQALERVDGLKVIERSNLYRSKPLGPQDQPDYVNAAVGALTTLEPKALLHSLKVLETELGRSQPVERWGPRRIDFDILLYGSLRQDDPELTLPHPGLTQRGWVLYPLAEIAPALFVPGHATVRELAARLSDADLKRIQ